MVRQQKRPGFSSCQTLKTCLPVEEDKELSFNVEACLLAQQEHPKQPNTTELLIIKGFPEHHLKYRIVKTWNIYRLASNQELQGHVTRVMYNISLLRAKRTGQHTFSTQELYQQIHRQPEEAACSRIPYVQTYTHIYIYI